MSLGIEVQKHLIGLGIETPSTGNQLSDETKRASIENSITDIMITLGLDLNDDSLQGTPKRVAKMYVNEIFRGLDYGNFPKITMIDNKMKLDSMVIVEKIDVSSTCEHHLITIDGMAKVAYIPGKTIIGLSKINRIVDFFSRRPQVQERLTQQIAQCLIYLLKTDNVAVFIKGKHYCVKSRGIGDVNSLTSTCHLSGLFLEDKTVRNEFLGG